MKSALNILASAAALGTLAYLAVGPTGALYDHPLACLGFALIGVGLCKHVRDQRLALAPADSTHPTHNR